MLSEKAAQNAEQVENAYRKAITGEGALHRTYIAPAGLKLN